MTPLSALSLPSRKPVATRPPAAADHGVLRLLRRLRAQCTPLPEARLPDSVGRVCAAMRAELACSDGPWLMATARRIASRWRSEPASEIVVGQALGVASEMMLRTLGHGPTAPQTLAAWMLLQGRWAEMPAGAGRATALALAAATAAWGGRAVLLLAADDAGARAQALAAAPFFDAMGLEVARLGSAAAAAQAEVLVATVDALAHAEPGTGTALPRRLLLIDDAQALLRRGPSAAELARRAGALGPPGEPPPAMAGVGSGLAAHRGALAAQWQASLWRVPGD